jgi:hypothetical protein
MEGSDMKHQSKSQSGSAGLVAFGVICAVTLGLSGAHFWCAPRAGSAVRLPQSQAGTPRPALTPTAPNATVAPVQAKVLAASSAPSRSAPAVDEAAHESLPLAMPPPPQLPEPEANPSPEAEQDPSWKAAKTNAIRRVVTGRAERLERDVAERERVGDVAGAAQLRILSTRLEKQLQAMDAELSELALAGADKPL